MIQFVGTAMESGGISLLSRKKAVGRCSASNNLRYHVVFQSPLGSFLREQASPPPRAFFPMSKSVDHRAYSRACLRILGVLLGIWFFVSFGCGILFREWMDEHLPLVGTAPFGFWMAQQGSIICFILILVAYAVLMKRLDAKFGYSEAEEGQ